MSRVCRRKYTAFHSLHRPDYRTPYSRANQTRALAFPGFASARFAAELMAENGDGAGFAAGVLTRFEDLGVGRHTMAYPLDFNYPIAMVRIICRAFN